MLYYTYRHIFVLKNKCHRITSEMQIVIAFFILILKVYLIKTLLFYWSQIFFFSNKNKYFTVYKFILKKYNTYFDKYVIYIFIFIM